ncbi:MAG: hypothetical protein ACFB00_10050 [Parvularculaceae bacterium]
MNRGEFTMKRAVLFAAVAAVASAAPAGEYRTKFVRSRGGRLKRVTIELIPSDGDTVTGFCEIKSGEVVSAAVVE